jgi:predicted membrane-bound spermidine synthase
LRPRWFLLFFFFSGLCSLIYEVVWLRLTMASFGVTTPTISIVLSVFMGGLALGSWAGGHLSSLLSDRSASASLRLYACVELLIGLSALAVPYLLKSGQAMLARIGYIEWASPSYHVASAICIAVALLPFTAAMGATFPLAMASIRLMACPDSKRSFSYLYLGNVLGAAAGTVVSALFLIELLGFRGTLFVAAALNALVAATAALFSFVIRTDFSPAVAAVYQSRRSDTKEDDRRPTISAVADHRYNLLALLFLTGLTSMALEVVWVRQFTPFLGTVVYAFATILTVYLLATFLGSVLYRRWSFSTSRPESRAWAGVAWFATGSFALLSLVGADPRLGMTDTPEIRGMSLVRVIIGIAPFCAAVGFLTPALVDRCSSGNPSRAGSAYAVNVLGCIVGPLVASFVLLPWLGERRTLLLLSTALLAVGCFAIVTRSPAGSLGSSKKNGPIAIIGALAAAVACMVVLTRDFESIYPNAVVKRDATATVIAMGQGRNKHLLVNGFGMTALITVTKTIAHLPLAFLDEPPRNALVICFGMGTSFRSATTWGIPVTAVELIPGVPSLFGYYHADSADVLRRPGARIIIDDGRRFLRRTRETYDVITIDPPPPTEGAGTSLLYSREFYGAARPHLRAGGILQQWLPPTLEPKLVSAVARSLKDSFPYVRVFGSYELWGLHFLASDRPIPLVNADDLAGKLPPAAAADIAEWELGYIPAGIFEVILQQEIPIETIIALDPNAPSLTDDRPVNEYYFLRRRMSLKVMMPHSPNLPRQERK